MGVAQGSLVSPILYDWFIDSLVSLLTTEFGEHNTFAYADDVAVLCLGTQEVRRALNLIAKWSLENGATINRRKCGILPISKKDNPDVWLEIDGVPVVDEYKYLGIPLDQALNLKHLVPVINSRVKRFNKRIKLIHHTVVGLRAKFQLWQTYIRSAFDYFGPSIAMCGQRDKFESHYFSSLKRALDLPQQTSNQAILYDVRHPSLDEIAGHHLVSSLEKIRKRFLKVPDNLMRVTKEFMKKALRYRQLQNECPVKETPEGGRTYLADLGFFWGDFEKNTIGLITGNYLTLRSQDKSSHLPVGQILSCQICKVPATQIHFIDKCPLNRNARDLLTHSISPRLCIPLLERREFQALYLSLRSIRVDAKEFEGTEAQTIPFDQLMEDLGNVSRAADAAADLFVSQTLTAMKQ